MLWEEERRLSSAFAKGGVLLLSLRLSHQQNCLHHHGSSPFVLKQQEVYYWLNLEKENEVEGFYMFVSYKINGKLWGLSAGTVITKETKGPNNREALLFGCIVSFVVSNPCIST